VPVPPHVFALSDRHLRYGQFVRASGGFRFRAYRSVALPADAFHSGILGGPLRDPRAFEQLVKNLVSELPGSLRDASLIIPDSWLRVTFTEITEVPKAADARDEVLRWKLKRLVPFRVDELRIGAVEVTPLPQQEEPRRLLLGFAIEQLLAQLEDAFAAAGVRLGQIANLSLSLIASLADDAEARADREAALGSLASQASTSRAVRFGALVVVEEGGYTLAFVRRGEPVLHRFKAFTGALPEEARAGFVSRDLKLTRNFLDEHFPGSLLSWVLLVAPTGLEPIWLSRLEGGLGLPAAPLDGRHLPPLQVEGTAVGPTGAAPPWREVAAMLGAARREVA